MSNSSSLHRLSLSQNMICISCKNKTSFGHVEFVGNTWVIYCNVCFSKIICVNCNKPLNYHSETQTEHCFKELNKIVLIARGGP
jgi:hypothetical protein